MRTLLYQKCVAKLKHNFVSTPVTTAAWVSVDASTDAAFDAIEVLNTSNAVLAVSVGTAGSEDNSILPYYILPGKSGQIPLAAGKSKNLSLKAMDSVDADVGDLYINFFG
jgi:P pilus assembly chaperone PapD